MSVLKKGDVFDAMATWNGFNYQGLVSIYVSLYYINHVEKSLENLESYDLELEWLEDFSILKNGTYHSIHQVKSYDSNYLNSYKTAILELFGKCSKIKEIEYINLHTIQDVIDISTKSTVKQLMADVEAVKVIHKEYIEIVNNEENFNHAFEKFNSHSITHVIQLKDMESRIKDEIKTFYRKYFKESYLELIENIDCVYHKFIGLINEHVNNRQIDIHLQEQPKDNPENVKLKISFEKLKELLVNKSIFEFNLDTAKYFLQNRVYRAFDEYCYTNQLEMSKFQELKHKIDSLKLLPADEFLKVTKKITPHVNINSAQGVKVEDLGDLIPKNGIKNCVLYLTEELNLQLNIDDYQNSFIIFIGEEKYSLTTIDDTPNKNIDVEIARISELIFANLIEDSDMLEILYETDYLVTVGLDGIFEKKIIDVEDSYDDSDINEWDVNDFDERLNKKITQIKEVKMIRALTVKEKAINEN